LGRGFFIKKAVAYKQKGHTFVQLREVFGISALTYYDWRKKFENGYFDIKVKRERKRKIDKEILKQAVEENPMLF
jgi:transposase